MANLSSDKVFVFPCVSRDIGESSSNDPSKKELSNKSKLMSEENITNMIKSITDKSSYLIEYLPNTDSTKTLIRFVLGGYYFELQGVNPSNEEGVDKSLYAILKMKNTRNEFVMIEGDRNNEFVGMSLENSITPTEDNNTFLQIFDSNGDIPEESYIKFNSNSVQQIKIVIDGGEVPVINPEA